MGVSAGVGTSGDRAGAHTRPRDRNTAWRESASRGLLHAWVLQTLCSCGEEKEENRDSRIVVDVQLPSGVLLFTTPWAAAGQASLPLTVS